MTDDVTFMFANTVIL